MKNFLFLLIIPLILSACITQRVKTIEEVPTLAPEAPLVFALSHDEVLRERDRSSLQGMGILFHDSDIAQDKPRQKIANVVVKNSWIYNHYPQLFIDLEQTVKGIGGNYVVVKKYVKRRNPYFVHRIKATVYKVDDVRPYEQMFRWTENRDIQRQDYAIEENENQPSLTSDLKHRMRFFTSQKGHSFYYQMINQFDRQKNHCQNCSDMEILRENLKFDLIELFQRRMVKNAETLKPQTIIDLEFEYPFLTILNEMLEEVEELKKPESLRQLMAQTNVSIKELDAYKQKLIIIGKN